MRKIILAILLLLVLIACKPTAKQPITIQSPFIGGAQGIQIDFHELRKDVFDGGRDPFDVIIKLQNNGETEVNKENIKIKLSGINPSEFGKLEEQLVASAPDDVIEIRKDATGNMIPSPPTFVEFLELNHRSTITGASAQFPLRADLCYLYRTKAVSKLCIRSDLLTPPPGGICEINEEKPLFNSGAPVQISGFKESTRAKDKVGFSFEIKNAGTGNIFERNSFCDRSQRKNENRVYVIINTGLSGLSCTGLESTGKGAEGFVTLYGGSKIVTCTQTANTRTDFEQLVNIEAIYDYEQTAQTTITVKSSGESTAE